MLRSIIITLIFCASVANASAQIDASADTEYMRLFDQATQAIRNGDYPLAERYLVDAMNRRPGDPNNVLLMSNLGVIRDRMGNYDGAIETLTLANELAPNSVTVLLNRARIYMTNGHKNEAVADYERVIQLDSTQVEPYFYRGLAALSRGDIVQTDKDFAMLKRLDPEGETTKHSMAITFTVTGQPAEAVKIYRELLQTNQSAEYYSGLVENLMELGELNDVSEALAEAMALYPSEAEFYMWRAALNKKRFRYDDAKNDARRAVELGASKTEVNNFINMF